MDFFAVVYVCSIHDASSWFSLRGFWSDSFIIFHSLLGKMSVENKVLFYGSPSPDSHYFLLYTENVAEADSSDEQEATFLICYLRGFAIRMYHQNIAENNETDKKGRSYLVVKAELCAIFGVKRDPHKVIQKTLLLKLRGKQSANDCLCFECGNSIRRRKVHIKTNVCFFKKSNAQ